MFVLFLFPSRHYDRLLHIPIKNREGIADKKSCQFSHMLQPAFRSRREAQTITRRMCQIRPSAREGASTASTDHLTLSPRAITLSRRSSNSTVRGIRK